SPRLTPAEVSPFASRRRTRSKVRAPAADSDRVVWAWASEAADARRKRPVRIVGFIAIDQSFNMMGILGPAVGTARRGLARRTDPRAALGHSRNSRGRSLVPAEHPVVLA